MISPINTSNRHRSNKKSAFTLIELLVVIAIIAILAAILFPVFARARENARRSSCSSNMKQIGLGLLQYNQDYDEKMPARYVSLGGGNNAPYTNWVNVLQPYVKSYQLFQCPSNNKNTRNLDADSSGLSKISYVPNVDGNGDGGASNGAIGNDNREGPSLSDFAAPSLTIAILESSPDFGFTDFVPNSGFFAGFGTNTLLFAGHLSTMNVLYADGHVKSMRPSALAQGCGTDTTNPWRRDTRAYTGTGLTNCQRIMENTQNNFK